MKPKSQVNNLYECNRVANGWYIKHNEDDSRKLVTDEMHNDVLNAIRRIVGDEIDKFGYIPAKAIVNALEHVSENFKDKQDQWIKENPHLRNTGNYTDSYYNVLHVMRHEGLIQYWKVGVIEILDEDKVLNEELKEIVRRKVPRIRDYDGDNIEDIKW